MSSSTVKSILFPPYALYRGYKSLTKVPDVPMPKAEEESTQVPDYRRKELIAQINKRRKAYVAGQQLGTANVSRQTLGGT